jgi:hypothetical protein
MNVDRLEQLAHQGCCRWNTHRLYPDLLQEARIVAWQNWDRPDSHVVRIIQLRVIDAARREIGRPGQRRQPELLTMNDTPGIEKQAIARHLHIHPSRVTQLLAQLRTHHQDTCT